jgi:tryptophan synthase alpha chain
MNRITETFEHLLAARCKALIPYITAGDPDLDVTTQLVLELERNGANIVELGVPFSDPVADGPTIQRASLRSLQQGTTLHGIVEAVASIREHSRIPIVLMTYYNPILAYGIQTFCGEAARAGVDGLIIPDLPPEESEELTVACREQHIANIFLVAPTSTTTRIELANRSTTGFVYCVSLTGVTGARGQMAEGVDEFMATVRKHTDRPLAIGFGISTPEHAREAAKLADGIIVGSAIINVMEQCDNESEMIREVGSFIASLRAGIDQG